MASPECPRYFTRPPLAMVPVLVLTCVMSVACAVTGTPHPSVVTGSHAVAGPPSLAGWKLTLPIAGKKGSAATVDPAAVSPPWLTSDADGGLTLWAPVQGSTTPNSRHARTELVSLSPFGAGTVRRQLAATVAITQVPRGKPDVIIGQIHGADDLSAVAFVMMHYTSGAVGVVVKQSPGSSPAVHLPLLTGVALGSPFDFTIVDGGDGKLTFGATQNGHTATASTPVPAAFAGRPVRFQAGAYQQADSTGSPAPDDGARMTIRGLTVVPGPDAPGPVPP